MAPGNRNHSTPVPGRSMTKAQMWEEPKTGDFHIYDPNPGPSVGGRTQILCVCPCGCGGMMNLPIVLGPHNPANKVWGWDGNTQSPTITPSIRDISGCRFHGHLRSGVWTFDPDSGQGATR